MTKRDILEEMNGVAADCGELLSEAMDKISDAHYEGFLDNKAAAAKVIETILLTQCALEDVLDALIRENFVSAEFVDELYDRIMEDKMEWAKAPSISSQY